MTYDVISMTDNEATRTTLHEDEDEAEAENFGLEATLASRTDLEDLTPLVLCWTVKHAARLIRIYCAV